MRRPAQKRLLTGTELEMLDAEIKEREMTLHSPDLVDMQGNRGVWAPNPKESAAHSGYASQQLSRLKRIREEGTEHDFSRKATKAREDKIRILEEKLKGQMVPRDFYYLKKEDNKDYNKTVDHLVKTELSQDYQREAQELKNLYQAREAAGAQLAGSKRNPDAGSIEHLRG